MADLERQATNKRIARNTLMLYFRMLLLMCISLYTSRVVLATLGVVDYGVYNVVGGMVAMFTFLNAALAQASSRYITFGIQKDSVEDQRVTFSMLFYVHALVGLLVLLLCESVGLWLFYNKLVIPEDRMDAAFWVLQCSLVTMLITVTQVPYSASINGHERMDVYAYISIMEGVLRLGAVIALKYVLGDRLLIYGILMMAVSLVVALTYRGYCHKCLPNCRLRRCWSGKLFKEVGTYTCWSLIGNLAHTLNGQGMNFLINIFFGPVYNATRGIATQVEVAVNSFLTNFLGASVPAIIKNYAAGKVDETIRLGLKSTKLGFLLFMCLSLPLIAVIKPVLSLWLVEPPPLAALFCLLSMVYLQVSSLGGTLQNMVHATGRIRLYQLCNGGWQLLDLPVAYVLYRCGAPVETYLWVLMCFSLSSQPLKLLIVRYLIPQFSLGVYLRHTLLPSLGAYVLPFLLALYCWHLDLSVWPAIGVCIGVLLLSMAFAWLIGLTSNERIWIKGIAVAKIHNIKIG